METKANYALVGFFTVLVMAAAFVFVYWMSQYGRGGDMAQLAIRIPGSANGLSIGSPVRFNGIPVGSVRSLAIDKDDPRFSVAMTEVATSAPVKKSTSAVLEVQGLTGAAYIELSGGSAGDPNILRDAFDNETAAVLQAEQSSVTNILSTADKILKRADAAITDVQGFVADARGPLTKTIQNAERFSDSLAANGENIDEFLKSVGGLSETFRNLSGRLDSTLASVDSLIKAVDPKKVEDFVGNVDKVSKDIADASGNVKETVEGFRKTAETFDTFGKNATVTLNKVDSLIAAVDAQKVSGAIDNISVATQDARKAIASVTGVADKIGNRQEDIDQIITDVQQMSSKLNAASTRVDGVLAKLDGFLGEGDSESLFAEAKATLQSIKQAADTLNGRIGPIADGLQRFSGSGLRDVEALVLDTRRTIQNLDSAISGFERNPQRLLFGGETVKQYDGRTRR
ncbi:MCE family protein [Shinella sp. AETb1-6]|jgi:phospholipid/cholesterol/gamma-HCH transport system substrate-binding protein|uniref:MlaD family protein n=1 Tax=Shinella sumterensis TaxID=1967501 RepID=A0AA50D9D8_9HYPH|nr:MULTISPECIES: MlaD family protein [Shinella]MDP9591196.1 phospholipid/cholesterol/gamma-HCH transport system substrate-binding protein [Shinella zoogloeoides]MCD1263479.1 MCE family protein [Shinella sumterensis]MXN49506.1 MCE family protein [Shinella sp. AETb1-6]TFE97474.1 MCE family protein [Shinella sumterensis]WLR98438.1 MlaD family protein [Shinella sumterensis]